MSTALPLLFVFALLITGCVGAERTLDEARVLVERVRPDVSLEDVRVDVWRSHSTVERWHRESHETLSFPSVERILKANRAHFARFHMEAALDVLIAQRLSADAPQLPAFVVPGNPSTVVARPRAAQSLHTMTHELGHIASWKMGYWQKPTPYLWLNEDEIGNPKWLDLDAFIAGWAVEEGTAELTAMAAMQLDRPELERRDPFEGARLAGGNALNPSILAPLVIRTQQFAYGNGLRYVAMRAGSSDQSFEEMLGTAWSSFRGTSREILFPQESSAPSHLATALKRDLATLSPKPTAATRWGAFLTFEVLSEQRGYEVREFLPLVTAFRDDLLLTFEGDRALWITEWADRMSAAEFAEKIGAQISEAAVETTGLRVTISWDAPAIAKAWWRAATPLR